MIALTFIGWANMYSQNYSSSIGVLGGYAEDGAAALVNYNYYLDRNNFIQVGAYLSFANDEVRGYEIPHSVFTLNGAYLTNFYSNRSNDFKFNGGAGLVAGYEIINNGKNTLDNGAIIQDNSKFIYGLMATVEIDYYLSQYLSLTGKYTHYYHINSDLGNFTPFAGVGFRYILF